MQTVNGKTPEVVDERNEIRLQFVYLDDLLFTDNPQHTDTYYESQSTIPIIDLQIRSYVSPMLCDTGSMVNIMTIQLLEMLDYGKILTPSSITLLLVNNTTLSVLGELQLNVLFYDTLKTLYFCGRSDTYTNNNR